MAGEKNSDLHNVLFSFYCEVTMNQLQTFAAMSALTFMATAPAFAAQHYGQDKGVQGQSDPTGNRTTTGETTTPGMRQEQLTPHRISKILGENVENVKRESLGEIKDIVVDPNGAVNYVVVSSGVLGVGGDPHPVPWKALRWSEERDGFVLDIDKEAFKKAPSFSSNNWPMEPSSTWDDFYRQHGISEGFGMQHGGMSVIPGSGEVEKMGFQKKVVLTRPNPPVLEGLGGTLWKW